MSPRGKRTVFAAASPSSLIPAGKEMAVEIDGCHAAAAPPSLCGSAVAGAPEEAMETDAGAGGCSWRASGVPSVAPSVRRQPYWLLLKAPDRVFSTVICRTIAAICASVVTAGCGELGSAMEGGGEAAST